MRWRLVNPCDSKIELVSRSAKSLSLRCTTWVSVSRPEGIVWRSAATQEAVFLPFCHLQVHTEGQLDVRDREAGTEAWEAEKKEAATDEEEEDDNKEADDGDS